MRLRALAWSMVVVLGVAAAAPAGPEITIDVPGEEAWAGAVRQVVQDALPALEKAAGFPCPEGAIEVTLAKDDVLTRGLDAEYLGDGKLAVKKQSGKHSGGFLSSQVVIALAKAWSGKVAKQAWLRETLAYLYAYHALAEAPQIYHHRTFLFEVFPDAQGAKGIVLAEWQPGPVTGKMADPEIALAFAYLVAIDRTLGEDVIRTAGFKLSREDPADFDGFKAALDEIAGKPTDEHFLGWYLAAPVGGELGDGAGAGGEGGATKPRWKVDDLFDPDNDLLLAFEEAQANSDPKKHDSDGDGRDDGEEVHDDETDPTAADPPRAVVIDGNAKKWMRLKKFKSTDKAGDSKVPATPDSDLISYGVCADADYLYVLVEAAAPLESADLYLNIELDRDGDRTPEYVVTLRPNRHRWIVDTRGQRDLSWAEYKNDRRMSLLVRGEHAEIRIPLDALRLEPKFRMGVFTRVKGHAGSADACAREEVDLDRWRH